MKTFLMVSLVLFIRRYSLKRLSVFEGKLDEEKGPAGGEGGNDAKDDDTKSAVTRISIEKKHVEVGAVKASETLPDSKSASQTLAE
jgi:hypothetical protein